MDLTYFYDIFISLNYILEVFFVSDFIIFVVIFCFVIFLINKLMGVFS